MPQQQQHQQQRRRGSTKPTTTTTTTTTTGSFLQPPRRWKTKKIGWQLALMTLLMLMMMMILLVLPLQFSLLRTDYYQFINNQNNHDLPSLAFYKNVTNTWNATVDTKEKTTTKMMNASAAGDVEFQYLLQQGKLGKCAILLFGLPRAFQNVVLPSLVQNVVAMNARYGCDYYAHTYGDVGYETPSNSGARRPNAQAGGALFPHHLQGWLQHEVQNVMRNQPPPNLHDTTGDDVMVRVTVENQTTVWKEHDDLLRRIRTVRDKRGKPRYMPWKEISYDNVTVANVIQMWHSIRGAWNLMMEQQTQYTRVAVLRSDVFYATPVDIWESGVRIMTKNGDDTSTTNARKTYYDISNTHLVIPGFGKFPVNDRSVYGPIEAVRVWATGRFDFVERMADWCAQHNPGMTMHSETFMKRLLLHHQRRLKYTLAEHPSMCFWRARADESVWIKDCDMLVWRKIQTSTPYMDVPESIEGRRQLIQSILGRQCREEIQTIRDNIKAVHCPSS
eukprot:scaffold10745_cov210-Amphora_coffeaeformis.AAC.3